MGKLDDVAYTVQAESPFDAREKAWQAWDADEDIKFRNCVKLYAVTWNPNPLDAGIILFPCRRSQAGCRHIENVDIPNDRIEKHDRAQTTKGKNITISAPCGQLTPCAGFNTLDRASFPRPFMRNCTMRRSCAAA
jgi:hypothetical protein